jgi:hypothetical protein
MADEILTVQGGTPAGLRRAADDIRQLSRSLSQDLQKDEQELASLQERLEKAKTDSVKAGLAARINAVRSTIAEERAQLSQLATAWQQANALIQARVSPPAPPLPPPPAPPAQFGAGGAGGGGFAALGLTSGQLTSIVAQYIGLRAIIGGIEEVVTSVAGTLKSWAEAGVEANKNFELMRAGLAASVSQNYTITDQQGKQLQGIEKINALEGYTLDLQEKIVASAIRSGTALEPFVQGFKQALPFGAQLHATVEQTLSIVERLATAGRALGIPFQTVSYQISEILRGTINSRTQLARELGLDQTTIRQAKEQGQLIDVLTQKTEAYVVAQGKLGTTFAFVSNAADILGQRVLAMVSEGGFALLRDTLKQVVDYLAVYDEKSKTFKLNPELKPAIDAAREAFTSFTQAALDFAPLLLTAFTNVAQAIGLVARSFAGVVGNLEQGKAEARQEEAGVLSRRIQNEIRDKGKPDPKTVEEWKAATAAAEAATRASERAWAAFDSEKEASQKADAFLKQALETYEKLRAAQAASTKSANTQTLGSIKPLPTEETTEDKVAKVKAEFAGVSSAGGLQLGGPTFTINGPVNIQAAPGDNPQQLFDKFVSGVRVGVGNRSQLLNSLR